MHAVRTRRVSRSAHSADGKAIGSDFVEDRVYRIKSVTPSATARTSPPPQTSPLLSHTCTTSSSAAGDESSSPSSPTGRVNIQEVKLTYMSEAGAAATTTTTTTGITNSKTTFPTKHTGYTNAGTFEFAERRRAENGARNVENGSRNVAHVPPYRVRNDGSVRYDYDEFIQISDSMSPLPIASPNSSKSRPYAMPLHVETTHAKRTVSSADGFNDEKQRIIRFEDSALQPTPRKRLYEPKMPNWHDSRQQKQQKEQQQWEELHKQQQQKSLQRRRDGPVGTTKTSRTVYESTSELMMSKSTTTTFHPTNSTRPLHAPPSQPTIGETQRRVPSPPSTGLPRYRGGDDIRLHARYDDDYIYRANYDGDGLTRTDRPPTTMIPCHTTTTFSNAPSRTATFQDKYDAPQSDHLLRKVPAQTPLWCYEFEKEEKRYYERVSKKNDTTANETAATTLLTTAPQGMTPFGSSKNFSDANRSSQRDPVNAEEVMVDRRRVEEEKWRQRHQNFSHSPRDYDSESARAYATTKAPADYDVAAPMRLIDYNTYRQEVEQLQREAMSGGGETIDNTFDEPVPLTPAIVLSPKSGTSAALSPVSVVNDERTPSRLKFFTKSELDEQTRIISPPPVNATATVIQETLPRSAAVSSRDEYGKAFDRKVEMISMSPRFRPLVQEAPTLETSKMHRVPSSTITSTRLVLQAGEKASSTQQPLKQDTKEADKLSATETTVADDFERNRNEHNQEFINQSSSSRRVISPPSRNDQSHVGSREFYESERQEYEEQYHRPDAYRRVASYTEEYEFRHQQQHSVEELKHQKHHEEEKQHEQQQRYYDQQQHYEEQQQYDQQRQRQFDQKEEKYDERKQKLYEQQKPQQKHPRKAYYIECATRQNVDINIENVSLHATTSFSNVVDVAPVTTMMATDAPNVVAATSTFEATPTGVVKTMDTATMSHEEIGTTETSTQHDVSSSVDADTSVDGILSHEAEVQVDTETNRELLETLRRELQYEEQIDLEVRRRQRVIQESSGDGGGPAEPLETLKEESHDGEGVNDELVETYEPVIVGDISEIIKDHSTRSSCVDLESMQLLEEASSKTVLAKETHTTDEPQGHIIGADVPSDVETTQAIAYESRTSSGRPRTPFSQPLQLLPQQSYISVTSAAAPPLSSTHASTRESSRDYISSSLSDYETRRQPRAYTEQLRDSSATHQHQSRYSLGGASKSSTMLTRPESVSSTRNVTTFSPIAVGDSGRLVSTTSITTLTSPTILEPRHSRVRSSSPLRSSSYTSYHPRMEYSSNISQRPQFVGHHRRAISPTGLGHRTIKTLQSETSSMSSGLFSPYGGSTAASTIRDAREREKKEMSDLNDRLASYIEKVRFLEAQNRKLAADLEFLRNRWGKDTSSIRDMYEVDIQQAQRLIDDTNRQREDMSDIIRKLEDEIASIRRKFADAEKGRYLDAEQIDELLLKLSALEGEIALLKRRIAILEDRVAVIKRENHRLMNDLQHTRSDLDQQTLNRIDYQNQVQTLIEEIDFLRRAHDSEIHDLQAMASRDTTNENREYFRNELSSAIREIRSEYDNVCNVQRVDMESWYKLKVQEIQTQSNRQHMEQSYAKEEIRRLRVQLGDLRGKLADLEGRNALLEKQSEELNYQLEDDQRSYESALNDRDSQIRKIRDECQVLMVELQMLLDTKQTLDAEIAIYRKMMDGEEDRAGLRQLLDQVRRTNYIKNSDETETMRVLRGETSSRQSYQRSAKGNVAIREVAPDASFIIIENTHRSRVENIGEWRLRRRIDNGKRELHFTFPHDFVLGPARIVKIWARNHGSYNPPDELVFEAEDSFGTGNNVHNFLYNAQGEERASLIQRSNHSASGQ